MSQQLLKLIGQKICRADFVEKHFSCRRRSDVLGCCSIQIRVVHAPDDSNPIFCRHVIDEQEFERVQSVAVPTRLRLLLFQWTPPVAHKFTHLKVDEISISPSVDFQDSTFRVELSKVKFSATHAFFHISRVWCDVGVFWFTLSRAVLLARWFVIIVEDLADGWWPI